MREIKVRAKRKSDGKWIIGNLIEHYDIFDRKKKYYYIESFSGEDRDEIIPETIGQFTGLLDNNDNEIYGDDIAVIPNQYPFFDYEKGFEKDLNETDCEIIDHAVPNYRGVVEWYWASWNVVLHCVNKDKSGISEGESSPLTDDKEDGETTEWEIIGNIHDNPELIKGEPK